MIIKALNIDPVALDLGFFSIHWYALMYAISLILAFIWTPYLAKRYNIGIHYKLLDNYFVWAVFGIILGGRLGYVLFYRFDYYLSNLTEILAFHKGGMSFHGGLLGILLTGFLYCRKNNINLLSFFDSWTVSAPIGLFFGRIGNFINGELWGRPTDGTWGFIFSRADNLPRHPSQLYEAVFEGIFIFLLLNVFYIYFRSFNYKGLLSGMFLIFYGLIRIIVENYREYDNFLGTFTYNLTLGQVLSVPMVILGAGLVRYSVRGR